MSDITLQSWAQIKQKGEKQSECQHLPLSSVFSVAKRRKHSSGSDAYIVWGFC